LREDISYADLFRALFPCGSVTGAPKIRAMQIIDHLEAGPRGVYCGSIGYVGPDRDAVFNVAIRTIVLRGGSGEMGTGSGIVWDSDPEAEYEECRLKAQFLAGAMDARASADEYELIETMRAEDGSIPLLPLHTDRMRASALYFGFPFDEATLYKQVQEVLRGFKRGCRKVRVTLDRRGHFSFSMTSLTTEPPCYRRVMVAHRPVAAKDKFLYHKTTRRFEYEEAFRRARALGYGEVLFVTERGEVTEGSRTNVFVKQGDALYTPPVACGLLGGVYRKHLLQTLPNASERVLSLNDVMDPDAVYLCNAVHGLQPVEDVVVPATPFQQTLA
ncbi:MAG: bifunctional chorismate-binding protein/class IV aminotransferase, partial [Rhodothermales bacterium]